MTINIDAQMIHGWSKKITMLICRTAGAQRKGSTIFLI